MMAVAEGELRQAEMEHDNLQKTISEMRTALAFATAGSRPVLQQALQNATGRLGMVEKKIKDTRTELEGRAREQAEAISYQAQKEAALSARERETFDGFLKVDYFTKKDFGPLEDFYANTWDRLSESGKDEMSHRVWQGIRRDEYKFTDLPKIVQEKEEERAYRRLRDSAIGSPGAFGIPESDKKDFFRAYESGNCERAGEVLDRKSFREKMFLGASSNETKDVAASRGKHSEGGVVAANVGFSAVQRADAAAVKSPSVSDVDAASFNLDGLKLAEAPAAISSRDIPTAETAAKNAKSFRGG